MLRWREAYLIETDVWFGFPVNLALVAPWAGGKLAELGVRSEPGNSPRRWLRRPTSRRSLFRWPAIFS